MSEPFRVAVVGAGPSGIYATEMLIGLGDVAVDVFERLPAPYGLLRYGVAPDHLKIKASIRLFRSVLDDSRVRFFGNVEVGTDLSVSTLRMAYDAVIFSFGASQGKPLGVPGEDRDGSYTATEFVNWYNGHPDSDPGQLQLDADSIAIVGAGNVAADVARILAKSPDELRRTDLPVHVLRALEQSKIRDIHLVSRRGPLQTKFSLPALMELGDLENADMVVKKGDLELDDNGARLVRDDRRLRLTHDTLQRIANAGPRRRPRRIHLHFYRMPVAVEGDDHVTGLRLERTEVCADGNLRATGTTETIPAQMVIRSVGYTGTRLPGLPFDDTSGVVPNIDGRVVDEAGVMSRVYVTGWIRRGPQGVIGTNKADAAEVVALFAKDREVLERRDAGRVPTIEELVAVSNTAVVNWNAWDAVDAAEVALGRATGAQRTKIHSRSRMLEIARARSHQEGNG